jgi:hypothetical protein
MIYISFGNSTWLLGDWLKLKKINFSEATSVIGLLHDRDFHY